MMLREDRERYQSMGREMAKENWEERGRTVAMLLSRRGFLSSIAAAGVTAMWQGIQPASGAWAQESAIPSPARAAFPPPADQEASYEWYLGQYTDPTIFTPIGLPGDPAETAVSPNGELLYANDFIGGHYIPGTPYVRNSLVFALFAEGEIVPIGTGEPALQSLEHDYFPIVITRWSYNQFEICETAFSEPLKGTGYQSGLESTLGWAILEVTNHSQTASPLTLLAAQMGDEREELQKSGFAFSGGSVQEKGSALFSAQVPEGFALAFYPTFPVREAAAAEQDDLVFLESEAGLFNVLAVEGKIESGQTVRFAFNRRFDFPGAIHWGPSPQAPVAADEISERSPDKAVEAARACWSAVSGSVRRFVTPDQALNNIVNKAMLDGQFLTKRWNGQYIVFDSVCYRCQWDDSSTKWFYALDLMGDHQTSERLLDTVFARQGQRKPDGTRTHEGCFSDVTNTERDGGKASWSSCNGWALWAMAEHARLTHDLGWIDKYKQKILDGCEWIRRERRFSLEKADNPCAGLLYGKFVCDMPAGSGQSGEGYFTYTDAISYMGLRGMGELLAECGHVEGESLLREAELYRKDIVTAIDRLTDKSTDPWYVPWILSAPNYMNRYLYEVVGPINLAYGGVLSRDDEHIQQVIKWIIDRTHHGSLEEVTAGIKVPEDGGMFYSQDLAIVLLELGRVEDFLRIFYTLLASNVSHQTFTTCEWRYNTQPHIHSIASLIRMFRTMMIQERDGGLYLLQGTPRRWMEQGKVLTITEAPTWYGALSLEIRSDIEAREIKVHIQFPERIGATPVRLRLRLPGGKRIDRVQVNGQPHLGVEGDSIILKGVTDKAEILAYLV